MKVALLQLLEELALHFLPRVNREAVEEAYASMGMRASKVRRGVARILAGGPSRPPRAWGSSSVGATSD